MTFLTFLFSFWIVKREKKRNKWATRCVKVCWQEIQTVANSLSVCYNRHTGPILDPYWTHTGSMAASSIQDILANDEWRHIALLS